MQRRGPQVRMLPDANPVIVLVAGAPLILPVLAPEHRHADEEGNLPTCVAPLCFRLSV